MNYRNMTVYFLTGTGNSYRAACWLAEQAQAGGMAAAVIAAEAARPERELAAGPGQLFGLVFPVHGFTAPWHVIRFALSLPRRNGMQAFVAVPRGATKIGASPVFPGMEGTAGYLIALILSLKGYTVRGVTGLDMPSNWTLLHTSLSPANVACVLARAKAQAGQLLTRILAGRTYFNGLVCLSAGLALAPLSLLYLAVGRFWLSKLFFAANACTGCGVCVRNCPNGAVVLRGAGKPRPYWTFACDSCMRCMSFCPEKAVEAGHSLGAITFYLTTVPAGAWVINQAAGLMPGTEWLRAGWVQVAVQYPYTLISLWLSYSVFHRLSRIPLINSLFTWTTLTHFYARYHEPGTRTGNFKGD